MEIAMIIALEISNGVLIQKTGMIANSTGKALMKTITPQNSP
jgi:hypothetical protein